MEIRKDLIGKTPKIEDVVCWNPAKYKGLVYGKIVEFRKNNGLPVVKIDIKFENQYLGTNSGIINHYVPKTGFIIINNN